MILPIANPNKRDHDVLRVLQTYVKVHKYPRNLGWTEYVVYIKYQKIIVHGNNIVSGESSVNLRLALMD